MPVLTETTDAAASTATTYTMAVGDYFYGDLPLNDADWVRVTLTAGTQYSMGMVGIGALSTGIDDTYLRVRDAAGTQVAFDDNDGPGNLSVLTYTPTVTGTYYIDAQAANPAADDGGYAISVTTGNKASFDAGMGAGALYRPDASWSGTAGTGAAVSWGIRASGTEPSGGNPFEAPTAAQVAAISSAMSLIEGVSGLDFTQVNPGGTTNSATMLFGAYTSTTDGAGAYAYFPGSTAFASLAGDTWLNNNSVSGTSLPFGSYSYFVMLHEIGHAIGLHHPGDYNAGPGITITYAAHAQFKEDTHQYTVMSYFDESNTTTSFGSYPDTLLLYDILALHQQYGADTTYMAGNTTYGFNTNAGAQYDFTTNTDPVLSIYDGSGLDTIDLSGYGASQTLNLTEGSFSNIGGFVGNVSIAYGAKIENAIGGSAPDTITGNQYGNTIMGGNEVSYSGTGTLSDPSGTGNNSIANAVSLNGLFNTSADADIQDATVAPHVTVTATGAGDGKYYSFTTLDANSRVVLDIDYGATGGAGSFDTWLRLLNGAGGELASNDDSATTDGAGGSTATTDSLVDFTIATPGTYYVSVGTFGDTGNVPVAGTYELQVSVYGAVTAPTSSGPGDTLDGGAGNDTLMGQGGEDHLIGGSGNDRLDGGAGTDTMAGGLGNDRYIVGVSTDMITGEIGYSGGGGIDTVESWVNYTLGANLEILRLQGSANLNGTGNAAPEAIVGQTGNNVLSGGGGADVITAKAGNDTIIGGGAADTLVGDEGDDVFQYLSISDSYAGTTTRDFINGFVHGDDLIDLAAIDASPYSAGDQAFTWIGTAAFSGSGAGSAGQLRYQEYGGNYNIVSADWNGDGTANMQIFVNLTNTMSASDFIL